MIRWLKFNAVGAMGAIVQLAIMSLLFHGLSVHYLLATVLAVEAAIIHNFLWHIRWTFSDRKGSCHELASPSATGSKLRAAGAAFLKFQFTAGAISIPGNASLMLFLVSYLNMKVVVANCLAIVICSAANFLVADRFSFRNTAPRQV